MSKLQELEQQLQNLQSEIEKLKQSEQGNQWVPGLGDTYCYISTICITADPWLDDERDRFRLSVGNVYRTEEEAEFELERRKVFTELKKYAREFVHGGDNCQIIFDYEDDKVSWLSYRYLKTSTLYFPSEEIARKAVQAVGEERVRKYYLGVIE